MNEVFIFNIVFRQLLSFCNEAIVSPSDDITEWDRRVVAFRADEASVDLGKKGGVAVLMRKDFPYLVDFHLTDLNLLSLKCKRVASQLKKSMTCLTLCERLITTAPKVHVI